jgi:glutaredoxin
MFLPFKLYGLSQCPHCQKALEFIQQHKWPCEVLVADNDPVISAGVEKITGSNNFPVLLSRLTQEFITGFKSEEYERLARVFDTLVRTGAYDGSGGGFGVSGEVPAAPPAPTPATN